MAGQEWQTGPRRAAYCDVDGTLADTTIVTPLMFIKRRALPPVARWLWLASLAAHAPWWLLLDTFSRAASNRAIYAHYRQVPLDMVRQLAGPFYQEHIRPRLFPRAVERLRAFQREGVQIVLVTGGLDVLMEPLAREFDAVCLAPQLETAGGVCTGRLRSEPFTGLVKAREVKAHAAAHAVDLSQSYAFGDAVGDLPMLECVGHPVAVNPDRRMARIAAERGWQLENWR